jgi:hypothetical protein
LLLEDDDFLQGVGVVLMLKLQVALKAGVPRLKPRHVLRPEFQFR